MQLLILHLKLAGGITCVLWGKKRGYFFSYFGYRGFYLINWKAITSNIYFNVYFTNTQRYYSPDSGTTLGHMIKTSCVLKHFSIINCK